MYLPRNSEESIHRLRISSKWKYMLSNLLFCCCCFSYKKNSVIDLFSSIRCYTGCSDYPLPLTVSLWGDIPFRASSVCGTVWKGVVISSSKVLYPLVVSHQVPGFSLLGHFSLPPQRPCLLFAPQAWCLACVWDSSTSELKRFVSK